MSGPDRQAAKRSWFGLLEAFLFFIVFLFLMDTALQYYVSSAAASKASEEVLLQTAVAIERKTAAMRETTEFLLQQAKSFAERKVLDLSGTRDGNAFFMEHMKAHPHITSVNYGDSAGNGYLIMCTEDRWRNRIKKGTEEGTVTWVSTDNQGKILSRERRKDDYDPRVRPWYRNAAGSPGVHWSRPYIFRTTRDVGITASMAIEPGRGKFPGVIGADVMLKDISRFFSDLKSRNKDLSIHLVSQEGEILASSEVENFVRILRKDTGEIPTISGGEFQDLAAAFRAFGTLGSDFLSFSSSGRSYYALRRPFRFSPDLKLSMILTVPHESLLSFFGSMNRVRVLFYLVIVAVSGFFFASRYLAPLRKLTGAARAIGTGTYDQPLLSGRKDEVGILVSEFSRMAEDLSAKQRELTSLVNNVPGVVYRGYPDWSLSFIGAEVEQVTGYASGEFTSGAARWKEIVHPEDIVWLRGAFRKAVREKSDTLHVEYRIRRRDGGIRWIADRRQLIYKENGALANVDGLLLDITERVRAEEVLRESEARYRRLFEHMQEGFAYCKMIFENDDPVDFTYLSVNASFETLTGLKDVTGKRVSEVIPGIRTSDPALFETYGRVARTGNPEKIEIFVEALQQWFFISVYSPEQGYFVVVFDVITDRKRAEAEKERLQTQLLQVMKMEAVGRLAGGVAHDFNNALTGIVGFGELLRDRIAGDEQAMHDLNEILRCAERASTLTRQLLAYARRQVTEPVNFNLSALVVDLMKLIGKVVGEHIEVTTSLEENVPTICADRGQIEQVVMNLCLNARDAMPKGGRLMVETGGVYLEEEYVRRNPYMRTGRYALLSVSDTGVGMDEKTRERAFDPFFTTKGPDKGTGLGLAMVYGIVKQHGGFIHLYSEPGKGTAFKVYFPAIEAEPDAVPEKQREENVCGGMETILLVEDEEAIRSFIERTLKELGYNVLVARNGEEAIEVFRQNKKITLAVLDVVMPRKGGREAFEEMNKQNPRLKVIFMSGYSSNGIHGSSVSIAGRPFLQKPFGPAILARKIREVLDTHD